MKRFRKGSATLEAICCCLILLFCLMTALHIYFQVHASMLMDEALVQISHDVVSCTSLDEAQQLAESTAKDRLSSYRDIKSAGLACEVYFAPGGEQEWKKGNFLTVELAAPVESPFSSAGTYRRRITVMIERSSV